MTDAAKYAAKYGNKYAMQTPSPVAAQPAVDLDTLVRSVLFIAVFLSAWISFHPFIDLSVPPQAVVEAATSPISSASRSCSSPSRPGPIATSRSGYSWRSVRF
jgi:hypothetical protein